MYKFFFWVIIILSLCVYIYVCVYLSVYLYIFINLSIYLCLCVDVSIHVRAFVKLFESQKKSHETTNTQQYVHVSLQMSNLHYVERLESRGPPHGKHTHTHI